MLYQVTIPQGVMVFNDEGRLVCHESEVQTLAERAEDGGFNYRYNGYRFYTCAGMIEFRAI